MQVTTDDLKRLIGDLYIQVALLQEQLAAALAAVPTPDGKAD